MRNNPPTFKGSYDPDGAQNWLQGIERIFRAMTSTNEQKVRLATHMLAEEAELWWGMRVKGLRVKELWLHGKFLEKNFWENTFLLMYVTRRRLNSLNGNKGA
jgi:hypothetical protein